MKASRSTRGRSERTWQAVAALLVWTAAIRGGVLLALPGGLSNDPDGYRRIAENVLRSGVYSFDRPRNSYTIGNYLSPTAYRPPLYPLVLTKIAQDQRVTPGSVGFLHLFLGLATVWLTWHLGRLWKLGHWSLVAGLLVSCDPILLNQSTQVMTETLATFLAVVAIYSLTKYSQYATPWYAALAGGSIGLAILCRPTFLPWLTLAAIVTPFIAALAGKEQTARKVPPPKGKGPAAEKRDTARLGLPIANLAALFFGAAVVLAPWTIRNYQVFGRPIVTTTHGGYTLALGNNPSFYRHLRTASWGAVWDSEEFDSEFTAKIERQRQRNRSAILSEVEKDDAGYEYAFLGIQAEPLTFFGACLYRVGQLWSPMPHDVDGDSPSALRQLLKYPVAAWYVAIFVLAIGGACSLRWKLLQAPWLWGVLLCLTCTAIHTFYWSNLRMRAPLMPFVCLLAAIGAAHVVFYVRKGRTPQMPCSPAARRL